MVDPLKKNVKFESPKVVSTPKGRVNLKIELSLASIQLKERKKIYGLADLKFP